MLLLGQITMEVADLRCHAPVVMEAHDGGALEEGEEERLEHDGENDPSEEEDHERPRRTTDDQLNDTEDMAGMQTTLTRPGQPDDAFGRQLETFLPNMPPSEAGAHAKALLTQAKGHKQLLPPGGDEWGRLEAALVAFASDAASTKHPEIVTSGSSSGGLCCRRLSELTLHRPSRV